MASTQPSTTYNLKTCPTTTTVLEGWASYISYEKKRVKHYFPVEKTTITIPPHSGGFFTVRVKPLPTSIGLKALLNCLPHATPYALFLADSSFINKVSFQTRFGISHACRYSKRQQAQHALKILNQVQDDFVIYLNNLFIAKAIRNPQPSWGFSMTIKNPARYATLGGI